jgi:hypothetical protein
MYFDIWHKFNILIYGTSSIFVLICVCETFFCVLINIRQTQNLTKKNMGDSQDSNLAAPGFRVTEQLTSGLLRWFCQDQGPEAYDISGEGILWRTGAPQNIKILWRIH